MKLDATALVKMVLEIADRDSLTLDDVLERPSAVMGVCDIFICIDGERVTLSPKWITARAWRAFRQAPTQAAVKQAYATLQAIAPLASERSS